MPAEGTLRFNRGTVPPQWEEWLPPTKAAAFGPGGLLVVSEKPQGDGWVPIDPDDPRYGMLGIYDAIRGTRQETEFHLANTSLDDPEMWFSAEFIASGKIPPEHLRYESQWETLGWTKPGWWPEETPPPMKNVIVGQYPVYRDPDTGADSYNPAHPLSRYENQRGNVFDVDEFIKIKKAHGIDDTTEILLSGAEAEAVWREQGGTGVFPGGSVRVEFNPDFIPPEYGYTARVQSFIDQPRTGRMAQLSGEEQRLLRTGSHEQLLEAGLMVELAEGRPPTVRNFNWIQPLSSGQQSQTLKQQVADAYAAGDFAEAAQIARDMAILESISAPTEAPGAFEAERRLVEARRATDIAQKSRSVDQQFDAALDAGDLDKARLIRNFKDEPSEWQIELLKMQYADNLPALKILFDYVDAIGRADVVPEDARALVEPTPPQPATPSERQKMVDPVGWEATQPPGTFQPQGPPGFGGETPAFVGDEVFPDTPAAALRRGDPDLFIPGEMIDPAGDRTFRGPVGPVPSTRQLSATDMASPLFQSSLQTVTGTADEPVVHLLVDGIQTPVLASQYAGFVRQATSLGRTVEVPNRDTGVFDTVSVGADGSIQSRPTVEDDGSVRFGPTGERFVTEKTLTADQVTDPLFQQAVGAGGVQPLAPFSWSQAEAGKTEGLPFTVTPETMDKIQRARDIDLSRSEPDYGSVTFVKPGGLSAEERRSLTDTVTAEIETSARNSRNRAFYLREQARNYPVSFPMTTIGSPPRTYSYGDQLLQEADELEARAAEREKNAATEIRERLAKASKGQVGTSSWSTEADIEEFKKQRPGWVEAYRTDPLPVAEPVLTTSRAEREATFIKEAQAFAPQKKAPRSFGPPRFVTT